MAVGVVGLATTAAMTLVPRSPAARLVVTTNAVEATPVAAIPLALAVVSPSLPDADARPAPRREKAAAVVRPAVARVRPAAAVRPAADARRAADVRSAPAVNAETVQAIWRDTDTRSLDRALSAVRQATLAFRRCNVQTSADQAVARCDLARGDGDSARGDAAWTIRFRRAGERWLIERISTRAER